MSASAFAIHGKMDRNDVNEKEYRSLVGRSLPHVIRTEKENDYYIDLLYSLDKKDHPTAAERELADLLTLLIEAFENQHYSLKRATPLENLVELMDANGLKQKDLLDVFGTRSIVSEILSGKRRLTVDHIQKLSKRFNVSPELFIR